LDPPVCRDGTLSIARQCQDRQSLCGDWQEYLTKSDVSRNDASTGFTRA